MSTNKKNESGLKAMDLRSKYKNEIVPEILNRYQDLNAMEVPALKKIVISMGLGDGLKDKNAAEDHAAELMMIAGQKPVLTKSKKDISNFKLRSGQTVGVMVTLRGQRMYDFLSRFCNITAPRIHDFRGFSKKQCDGRGNYNFGISDQQVFLEVNLEKVKRTQGMNITMVTSAKDDSMCIELLTALGFPFEADKIQEKTTA